MQLKLGYGVSSLIFLTFFIVTLAAQLKVDRYRPAIYWAVVVATTTVGTTTSDYLDRTMGLGYVRASILLGALVVIVLVIWHFTTGRIAVDHITTRTNELFYWLTILVSNTLGTALGDYTADDLQLGFAGGALLFAGLIAAVAAVYYFTKVPRSILFWAAYVLTRPLGATLGDVLTKPLSQGGLNLSRIGSSLVLAVAMVAIVVLTHRRSREQTTDA